MSLKLKLSLKFRYNDLNNFTNKLHVYQEATVLFINNCELI
jgi:hypothetical protein